MTRGEGAANRPAGCDRRERIERERPLLKRRVRNGEAMRSPMPAAPGQDVEVEHSTAPAAAPATAEVAFDGFEAAEHLGRFELAFDKRDGVGEIASGTAVCGIEDDPRGIEQVEVCVEARDCGLDDTSRAAEAPVRPVRSDGDGVEVGLTQTAPFALSLSKGCLSYLP